MIEKTENQIMIRIKPPEDFIKDSLKTVNMGDGVSQIMGIMMSDPSNKMQTQSLRFDTKEWTEEEAKMWAEKHNFMHKAESKDEKNKKDIYCSDLKNVEIFGCGQWNGKTFTEKELDGIINSYNEIGEQLQPYFKLGHSEAQLMHKKSNELFDEGELPALGYIKNLKRVGKKLLADVSNVPKVICDLINKKAYKRISVELYKNFELSGFDKKFPLVLRAVSLLGGQTPEVTNLSDVLALYSQDKPIEIFIYSMSNESKKNICEGANEMDQDLIDKFNKEKEILEAQKKELESDKKLIDTFNKEKEMFEAQKKELELDKKQHSESIEKLSKLQPILDVIADKVENTDQLIQFIKDTSVEIQKAKDTQAKAVEILTLAKKKEINNYVDELIGKKITPVQAEIARSILSTIDKFEEDNPQTLIFSMKVDSIDLKEEMNLKDAFKSFIKAQPNLSLLEMFASSKQFASGNIDEERKTLVDELINQDKSNLSNVNKFAKAQSKLIKIRPDLFE